MDVNDAHEWWTIDQAAEQVGITRAAVERYIREGLPKHLGKFVNRDQFLAEYRARLQRQRDSRATRGKPTSA